MKLALDTVPDTSSLLAARIRVQRHAVYRCYPSETVILDLRSGSYHGLDAAAGQMLDALDSAPCLRDAAAALSTGSQRPAPVLERELCQLCWLLLERGLIEIDRTRAS